MNLVEMLTASADGSLEDFLLEPRSDEETLALLAESQEELAIRLKAAVSHPPQQAAYFLLSICSQLLGRVKDPQLISFPLLSSALLYPLLKKLSIDQSARFQSVFFQFLLFAQTQRIDCSDFFLFNKSENDEFFGAALSFFYENAASFAGSPIFQAVSQYEHSVRRDRLKLEILFRAKRSQLTLDVLQSEEAILNFYVDPTACVSVLSFEALQKLSAAIQNGNFYPKLAQVATKSISTLQSTRLSLSLTEAVGRLLWSALLVQSAMGVVVDAKAFRFASSDCFESFLDVFDAVKEKSLASAGLFVPMQPTPSRFCFLLEALELREFLPVLENYQQTIVAELSKFCPHPTAFGQITYEPFDFHLFCKRPASKAILLEDSCWQKLVELSSGASLTTVLEIENHLESLCVLAELHAPGGQIGASVIVVFIAFSLLSIGAYGKALRTLSKSIRSSVSGQSPYPNKRYATFARMMMLELCFIHVNEMESKADRNLAVSELRLANDVSWGFTPSQLIIFTSNLVNVPLTTFALEHLKAFLAASGKKREFFDGQNQLISVVKVLFRCCTCITVFEGLRSDCPLTENSANLLRSSTLLLLQGFSSDPALVDEAFVPFLRLLKKQVLYCEFFMSLFAGFMQANQQESEDRICLSFFKPIEHVHCFDASKIERPTVISRSNAMLCSKAAAGSGSTPVSDISAIDWGTCKLLEGQLLAVLLSDAKYFCFAVENIRVVGEILFLQEEWAGCVGYFLYYLCLRSDFFSPSTWAALGEGAFYCEVERIVCCLWNLGATRWILWLCQLMDPLDCNRHLDKLVSFQLLESDALLFLYHARITEYLASAVAGSSLKAALQSHLIKRIPVFLNEEDYACRLLQSMSLVFLLPSK